MAAPPFIPHGDEPPRPCILQSNYTPSNKSFPRKPFFSSLIILRPSTTYVHHMDYIQISALHYSTIQFLTDAKRDFPLSFFSVDSTQRKQPSKYSCDPIVHPSTYTNIYKYAISLEFRKYRHNKFTTRHALRDVTELTDS